MEVVFLQKTQLLKGTVTPSADRTTHLLPVSSHY